MKIAIMLTALALVSAMAFTGSRMSGRAKAARLHQESSDGVDLEASAPRRGQLAAGALGELKLEAAKASRSLRLSLRRARGAGVPSLR